MIKTEQNDMKMKVISYMCMLY